MYIKECRECKNEFFTDDKRRKYCSVICYNVKRKREPSYAFPKGNIPWNKNLKGIHLSPDSEFKKGKVPCNIKSLGSVTYRIDKSGNKRAWVKTGLHKWTPRAIFIWEIINGEIPSGGIIHHKNHNSLDDKEENLVLLSREEHIKQHQEELYRGRVSSGMYLKN